MYVLVRLTARIRMLFRSGRDRDGMVGAADLEALAPWCRGHVLAVLRERAQGR
jgi:hypothetical protein